MKIESSTTARRSAAWDKNKQTQAWTLVEILIAAGLFSICGMAMASLYAFGMSSFVGLSNYSVLDKANREAMDLLTSEVRQAKSVLQFSANPPTLSLLNGEGKTVVYSFNPASRKLVRDSSDGGHRVLLENCNEVTFGLYQRNPSNAVYGVFPVTGANGTRTTKLLDVTWRTAMDVRPSGRVNSENVQTARIVIRKSQAADGQAQIADGRTQAGEDHEPSSSREDNREHGSEVDR